MNSNRSDWRLAKTYVDKTTGKNIKSGHEFQQMIYDCCDGKVDVILTKSIGHFGRNTKDTFETLQKLSVMDIEVFFQQENIWLSESNESLVLDILAGFAQIENENRSLNIKSGIDKKIKDGASKLYQRKCFDYSNDKDGNLIINQEQAKVVKLVFSLYLAEHSIVSIIGELEKQSIKSPMGKEKWSKRAIETMLENEKYKGQVIIGKTYICSEYPKSKRCANRGARDQYQMDNSHEGIISEELFAAVQRERKSRSNIETVNGIRRRRNTHYSCRNKNIEVD